MWGDSIIKFLLVLGTVGLFSCVRSNIGQQQSISVNTSQKDKSQIVNGHVVDDLAVNPYNSVVGLYDTKEGFLCTGTLITSSTVLTAAHCIEKKGRNLIVIFGKDAYDIADHTFDPDYAAQFRRATGVLVHPDYDYSGQKEYEINDLALVYLEGELPDGFSPAEMSDSVPEIGQIVSMVGYGVSQVDMDPFDGRRVPNIYTLIEQGSVYCSDETFEHCFKLDFSGDGILRATETPDIMNVLETEFVVNETKSGTCSGDSGGPVFKIKDGHYFIAGITSRGPVTCNIDGVYTRVDSFLPWIIDHIK